MSTRKSATLSPTAGSRTTKSPTLITSDYIEAVQTLNETTMKQACEWLLDDGDMEADEKILDLYYKCSSALKVIQKQQPSSMPLPPGPPNLSSLSNGGRSSIISLTPTSQSQAPASTHAHHRGSLTGTSKLMPIAKGGVLPMRRTAMAAKPRNRTEGSSDDLTALATAGQPLSKKARLAGNAAAAVLDTNNSAPSARAPPPAALNFLAKLNKDVGANNSNSSGGNTGTNDNGGGKAPNSPSNSAKRSSARTLRGPS